MALFPRWSELNTIATVSDALQFFNVEDDVWQAFLNQVGDCREDLRLVAALSRPAVLAGSGVAILPDGSALSPLQATQVGLVWRLARRVMAYHGGITEDAFVDVEVWLDNPAVPSQSPTSTPTTGGSGGGVKEKVLKMSSLIDQADDSELLPPTNGELNKWHQTYVAIMGSQPDEAEEPSPNQLAALHKRVFINDHPPYCDFGVWLPFERKMTKVHRFRVYTPLGDGSFLQKDLPGPGSFQAWMASWRVFRVACLMLNVATLSALENYARHIERLVTQWPSAWGLIAAADDQARAEKMSRIRRTILLDQSMSRQVPRDWDPGAPWSCVLGELTKDTAFWSEKVDEELMQDWRRRLGQLFETKEHMGDGVVLKENILFKSTLREEMWGGWGKMARDPDTELVNFIRCGAPLGMAVEIPTSQGIFPGAGTEDDDEEKDGGVEFNVVKGMLNYKSVTDQPDQAKIEIERNVEKGFVVRMDWEEEARRFGAGTCSKLALILKEKPDGSTKRRLILDMKRSGGNDRAIIPERIVLPRLADVVTMLRDLHAKKPMLAKNIAESGVPVEEAKEQADETEFILVDLADAFCHFAVDSRELKHCVTPDETSEGCLVGLLCSLDSREPR